MGKEQSPGLVTPLYVSLGNSAKLICCVSKVLKSLSSSFSSSEGLVGCIYSPFSPLQFSFAAFREIEALSFLSQALGFTNPPFKEIRLIPGDHKARKCSS